MDDQTIGLLSKAIAKEVAKLLQSYPQAVMPELRPTTSIVYTPKKRGRPKKVR